MGACFPLPFPVFHLGWPIPGPTEVLILKKSGGGRWVPDSVAITPSVAIGHGPGAWGLGMGVVSGLGSPLYASRDSGHTSFLPPLSHDHLQSCISLFPCFCGFRLSSFPFGPFTVHLTYGLS